MDYAGAAGAFMQIVDVLGKDGHIGAGRLKAGEGDVPRIQLGSGSRGETRIVEAVRGTGVFPEAVRGRHVLDPMFLR